MSLRETLPRLRAMWSSQLELGLSVEAKVRRMVGRDEGTTQSRSRFGWIAPDLVACGDGRLGRRSGRVVAVYGNSFAKRLGEAIESVAPDVVVCQVTAPLATQSWAFAAWQEAHDRIDADVDVFTVTSGRVLYTASMSPMVHLAQPYVYFNPRYRLDSERLTRIEPVIQTLEDLRIALYSDATLWRRQRQQLADHDPFFDPFVFDASVFDRLALTCIARRVRSKLTRHRASRRVLGRSGFRDESEEIGLIRAMIGEFARVSRACQRTPIVCLVSLLGHGTRLQRAVEEVVHSENVPTVSSHEICPPNDASCFFGENGHFTRSKDIEIARAVLSLADRHRTLS